MHNCNLKRLVIFLFQDIPVYVDVETATNYNNMKTKLPKKLQKKAKEFEEAIELHLISTNYKPLDGRTKLGKPIKKLAKVLDFGAYLIACATISFILVTVAIQWMSY